MDETLPQRQFSSGEYNILKADGSGFPAELSTGAVKDGMGKPCGFVYVIRDITERKRREQELSLYQKNLRSLTFRLSLAEELERRRIAISVHDQIGQGITLLGIKLGQLLKSGISHAGTELEVLLQQTGKLAEATQNLAFDLSSPILYELGLKEALGQLTDDYSENYGLVCHFVDDEQRYSISEDVSIFIFQAARELLTNVLKHAKATDVRVILNKTDDHLVLIVQDDGTGISPSASQLRVSRSLGLFSIRERLRHIGGHLQIESVPKHGTTVTLTIPLRLHEPPSTLE